MTNIQNFKLPTSWRGRDAKKDYEDVMNRKNEPAPIIPVQTNKLDTNDFIYVPSIKLYVAKERTHLGKNWKDCWTELQSQNYKMPKINEFREFLKYLISEPNNQEYQNIFKEITEVRNPWRSEWLDANFKVENKGLFKKSELYILTENESKKEKLEDCLMSDKNPGIELNDWINGKNINSQGLPNKNISSGSLYYWYPRSDNNSVAWFGAYVSRADLDCDRSPSDADSDLGVRPCKAGPAEGIK